MARARLDPVPQAMSCCICRASVTPSSPRLRSGFFRNAKRGAARYLFGEVKQERPFALLRRGLSRAAMPISLILGEAAPARCTLGWSLEVIGLPF